MFTILSLSRHTILNPDQNTPNLLINHPLLYSNCIFLQYYNQFKLPEQPSLDPHIPSSNKTRHRIS